MLGLKKYCSRHTSACCSTTPIHVFIVTVEASAVINGYKNATSKSYCSGIGAVVVVVSMLEILSMSSSDLVMGSYSLLTSAACSICFQKPHPDTKQQLPTS